MLTRRGVAVALSPLPFVVAGRVFGIIELYMLAAGAAALVGTAVLTVWLRHPTVTASRSIHPPRVPAGTPSRVDLEIRNHGTRRSPVVAVDDPFDGGRRWARFLTAPLAPGARERAAYRVPTERRGIFDVGPLEVALSDPFGLATRKVTAAGTTKLTVYPHIDRISPLPPTLGNDPYSGADHPTALSGLGEDFYALREYEIGDDTRRVHWPSTARVDELMIRQDEMPWQSRSTILLDVRRQLHTPEAFELAVSAAASIHDACRRQRSLTRLVTTAGVDSGFSSGHAHDAAVLEHLAAVTPSRDDRFAEIVTSLRGSAHGGAIAVVTTGDAPPGDLDAIAGLRSRYGAVVIVVIDRSAHSPTTDRAATPAGRSSALPRTARIIRVDRTASFSSAWQSTFGRRTARLRTRQTTPRGTP